MQFYILDVFAGGPYRGNQLAVFFSAGPLDSLLMQTIAREINFSETVFLSSWDAEGQRARARIFTPRQEVRFAGHPVIGSAYALHRHLRPGSNPGAMSLALPAGEVPLEPLDGSGAAWQVRQPPPRFGERIDRPELQRILSLPPQAFDTCFTPQIVDTGLPHVIVAVHDRKDLGRCRIDPEAYAGLVARTGVKNILVFCPDPHEAGQDYAVRMFAPDLGIPEDPATGSGNGCLAAYLLQHQPESVRELSFTVGQGYEMGRPSQLQLHSLRRGEGIEVRLGGRVIEIAAGRWRV